MERGEFLMLGSIHYPRSTSQMWPDLIQKAKDGGLDVIQTYVFGMVMNLLLEKGFPVWLKYVPGIAFRTDNEPFKYGPVEWEIGALGKAYTKWAAQMVVGLDTGVPWVMCKQEDAPDPVIDTCNRFYCENFKPNKNIKPKMWTENWTGWYIDFGGAVHVRPAEDLAFSIARFIQNGGSFVNYYMVSYNY
ncbi:unnamed protein product [Sphenostylis stenocarpa]|uniref:beta-galactosidase n=1 Tax=Sphenostylis stenocarpa TaxID=92480 RepID=A0AA86T430_9FABA|nr:unnamed protein product [Sphenostylis stenocarpa]